MRCIWLKSLFDFLIKTLFKSWLYASAVTFLLLLICSYIDIKSNLSKIVYIMI